MLAVRPCMQGQWNHDKAYYRCKFTADYPTDRDDHPKNVYVKEESVVNGLNAFLNEKFNEDLDETTSALAGHNEPDPAIERRQATLRDAINDCDRRLVRYRSAFDQAAADADSEIGPFIKWIAEVERERKALELEIGRPVPGDKLTKPQLRALLNALRDIVALIADADEADCNEPYQQLGVSLTYHPDGRVAVEALPRGVNVGVGGASRTLRTRDPWVHRYAVA